MRMWIARIGVVSLWVATQMLATVVGSGDGSALGAIPTAKGDLISCPYPGLFRYVDLDIKVIVSVSTRWSSCWFPRENNNSFYRCIFKSGEGGLGGGIGGNNVLGLGGNGRLDIGIGGGGATLNCSFVCPDGTQAKTPNPTGDWGKSGVSEGTEKIKCPSLGHVPDMLPYEIPVPGEPLPQPPPGEPMNDPNASAAVTNPAVTDANPNKQVNPTS